MDVPKIVGINVKHIPNAKLLVCVTRIKLYILGNHILLVFVMFITFYIMHNN